MKYDLIIFDCDGTLVDSESLINKAFSDILIAEGYTEYTYEYCFENFSGVCYSDLCKFVIAKHPHMPFKEIEEKFVERANALIPTTLKEIPNATKLLESIRHIPKCVGSNGEHAIVSYSLEVTGLMNFFDPKNIFTYEMVRAGKPEPDLYLYAAQKMGTDPKRCLVIEDSIVGATAGIKAGMDVLAIIQGTHKYNLKSEMLKLKPLAIIEDLLEVTKYLD
jgi:HAD superfamily hydrolase (TIGR01509 family)